MPGRKQQKERQAAADETQKRERQAAATAKQDQTANYLAALPKGGRLVATQMVKDYPNTWLIDPRTSKRLPKSAAVVKAAKELKANQIDVQTELGVEIASWYDPNEGRGHFANSGPWGLAVSDFLLGEGTDAHEKVGRFHEGLGVSVNVLLDLGRAPRVETIGMTITAERHPDPNWGGKVVTWLRVVPNARTDGTDCGFECSEDEFRAVQALFMAEVPLRNIWEGMYEPAEGYPTSLYAKGLKITALSPLLMTYAVDDLAYGQGRDRDAVDTQQALSLVAQMWCLCVSDEAIRRFLSVLKGHLDQGQRPVELEFNTNIVYNGYDTAPGLKAPSLWRRLVKEIFGEKIALPSDPTSDLIALQQGYRLITAPPPMEALFHATGVQRTSAFTDGAKAAGYLSQVAGERLIAFPLTVRAAISLRDAGKEALRNAKFYGAKVDVRYKDGYMVIENHGANTIRIKDIAVGEGVERRDVQQFHEGLAKMMLAFAACSADATIEGVGIVLRPEIRPHHIIENLECLHVKVLDGDRRSGAVVRFKCDKATYRAILESFINLEPIADQERQATCRLPASGEVPYIAVDGELIDRPGNLLFCWELHGRGFLEPHRKSVKWGNLLRAMRTVLGSLEDPDLIGAYLQGWRHSRNSVEYTCGKVSPKKPVLRRYREYVEEHGLSKLATATGTSEDDNAREDGFEVVMGLPEQLEALFPKIGIMNAIEATAKPRTEDVLPGDLVPPEKLTLAERYRLGTLRRFIEIFDPQFNWDKTVQVAQRWNPEREDLNQDDLVTWGLCVHHRKGTRILLLREILADQQLLDATFHEEYLHSLSPKNGDRSREFQHAANDTFARLVHMYRQLQADFMAA